MTLKKLDESKYSVPTQLIYGKSVTAEWDYSHHVVPPISASSTYRLASAERGAEGFGAIGKGDEFNPINVYARMSEPNNQMLQHVLATAEGGEVAVTFASGMAAVHAAVCFSLSAQDEVVSHNTVYGCTYSLMTKWLPRFGVKVHFVNLCSPELLRSAINERTRIVYLESPVNPTLELIDIPEITRIVAEINATRPPEKKILTVMDNTFSTPWCQRPIQHGVDIVVHSLTKGISGFGTVLGGAVVTRKEFQEELVLFRKDFGGVLVSHTAWNVLLYGISTLSIRMPRQQQNAVEIARFLEQHPKIAKVRYPGLPSFPQFEVAQRMLRDYHGDFAPGFMIYFTLKGAAAESKERGREMMNFIAQNSYTVTLAVSLGQLRTLIEHPGSMTHAAYPAEEQLARGIDPGGIRLAVGIEEPADIIRDLDMALTSLS